jgi:soluble lytic murein transglycosylase-like protein
MFLEITRMYFRSRRRPWVEPGKAAAWDGVATPGEIGRPGDLPVPAGQQVRRWAALLALAALALPGAGAAQASDGRPTTVTGASATRTAAGSRLATPGGLPNGDAGEGTPAAAAPWEAGVVEADGKPLPTAPPPGPVPVDGIPQPAVAGGTGPGTPSAPAAGETARAVPNQVVGAPAGASNDLVPADREYLRPILIRYAQENGLPADLVMALAWVESSWRRTVVSDVGAIGVMQLMPDTVDFVSKKLLGLRSDLDPKNATSNIRMGTTFLRHLLDQNHGNVRQTLIAYNQGLTSLRAQGSYAAAERYADHVLALRPQFRTA